MDDIEQKLKDWRAKRLNIKVKNAKKGMEAKRKLQEAYVALVRSHVRKRVLVKPQKVIFPIGINYSWRDFGIVRGTLNQIVKKFKKAIKI